MRAKQFITYRGETKPLVEWAKEIGIDRAVLRERLIRWPLERAMTEPKHNRGKGATINHETMTWADAMPYYDAARGIAYILTRDADRVDDSEDVAHELMLELVTKVDRTHRDNRTYIIGAMYNAGKTLLYASRAAKEWNKTDSLDESKIQ